MVWDQRNENGMERAGRAATARNARPVWTGALLCINDGHGRHVDDLLHVGILLEDVDGVLHADEDGADRRGPAQLREQLVRNVAGAEVREDQHVRGFLERR
jgi:hypothetical protein